MCPIYTNTFLKPKMKMARSNLYIYQMGFMLLLNYLIANIDLKIFAATLNGKEKNIANIYFSSTF